VEKCVFDSQPLTLEQIDLDTQKKPMLILW